MIESTTGGVAPPRYTPLKPYTVTPEPTDGDTVSISAEAVRLESQEQPSQTITENNDFPIPDKPPIDPSPPGGG